MIDGLFGFAGTAAGACVTGACGASAEGAKASFGTARGETSGAGERTAWAEFDIFSLNFELNGSVGLVFSTVSSYIKTKPFGATKILHCKI